MNNEELLQYFKEFVKNIREDKPSEIINQNIKKIVLGFLILNYESKEYFLENIITILKYSNFYSNNQIKYLQTFVVTLIKSLPSINSTGESMKATELSAQLYGTISSLKIVPYPYENNNNNNNNTNTSNNIINNTDTILEKRMNQLKRYSSKVVLLIYDPKMYEPIILYAILRDLLFPSEWTYENLSLEAYEEETRRINILIREIPSIIKNSKYKYYAGVKRFASAVSILDERFQKDYLSETFLQKNDIHSPSKKRLLNQIYLNIHSVNLFLQKYIKFDFLQSSEQFLELTKKRRLPIRFTSPERTRKLRSGCFENNLRILTRAKLKPTFENLGVHLVSLGVNNDNSTDINPKLNYYSYNKEKFYEEVNQHDVSYFDVSWNFDNYNHIAAGIYFRNSNATISLTLILNTHPNNENLRKSTFVEKKNFSQNIVLNFPQDFQKFAALPEANFIPLNDDDNDTFLLNDFISQLESETRYYNSLTDLNERSKRLGIIQHLQNKIKDYVNFYINAVNPQNVDTNLFGEGQCQDWSFIMGYLFLKHYRDKVLSIINNSNNNNNNNNTSNSMSSENLLDQLFPIINEFYFNILQLSKSLEAYTNIQREIGLI